jgi:type I restriction-modification system DNA methylase subunit
VNVTERAAERLAKLDLSALKSRTAAAINALCNEAFDKEALTNEFFKKLDSHIKAIESDLREHQRMSGPEAFGQAQLLIERLIFLYFAQNRGWLNQEADYLVKNFGDYANDGDGFGYYQEFLHRLFHTLAESGFGNRLPGIPFLNGGLFDDDEFRLPSSKLRIRNVTFASLFEDLLEAYNFTVREDTPLSQEVAVDPEMLGKIFESIVLHAEAAGEEYQAPDKRKATGSYYTPRIVVHFICRETLRLYFAQRGESLSDPACRSTWAERLTRLFKEIDPTDGFSEEELKRLKSLLSPLEAARCLDLLCGAEDSKGNRAGGLRTLDPAVGSGAFPVGLLHELISLQRIFETAAHGYDDPVKESGTRWLQKAKEDFIERSLFGVDIQQQAIEICQLRLWLSLLVDYELGVNPFEAERGEFIKAINKISQLPNLEMNFKRGDSLHDYVCGNPVRIEPQKPSQYAAKLERIERLGAKLHKAKRGETKKKTRLEILEKRIALARRIIDDEIVALRGGFIAGNWFGESISEREERERTETEISRLEAARKQVDRDEGNLGKLKQRQFDKEFYRKLRELEGSEMDGPLNFAWRIDFPHVLSGAPIETLRGEFALINQAQRQQELAPANPSKPDSGFDLIVGNPPFVTARNAVKRELYRERWPRVSHMKFLLVCPFFEMSFGLLRPDGQLGFIVSNAFAKREFGKPLVEDFFPTVDLEKVVDCSGLMFPGHGTPTCIVFGVQRKPSEETPVRVTAILSGGGDLRTPPEESALWHTIAAQNDNPGYTDDRIIVADRPRKELAKHPWSLDTSSAPTVSRLNDACRNPMIDLLADDIGVCTMTNADDIFLVSEDAARRNKLPQHRLPVYLQGEELRNWEVDAYCRIALPYEPNCEVTAEKNLDIELRDYLRPFKDVLESRHTFGNLTFKQAGRVWYEFERMNANKYSTPLFIVFTHIATHNHFAFVDERRVFGRHAQVVKLGAGASSEAHHLLVSLLNSGSALFWLQQVCFSKRESEEAEKDTYFEFSGGKVQQLPIPAAIADALHGRATRWRKL